MNFFQRNPKERVTTKDGSDSEENNDDDSDAVVETQNLNDDDEEDHDKRNEEKPLLTELFDKFKDFLEAKNKQSKMSNEDYESDGGESGENSSGESSGDNNDTKELEKDGSKVTENRLKISLKKTLSKIFNRKPFTMIFNLDNSEEDKMVQVFEDSEEDEILYQKLLKEERDHAKEHTEQLIKQTSEEEATKTESTTEIEDIVQLKKKQSPKLEKKSKEEAHLSRKEFEKLILSLPSFIPDYSKVKNPECQKQGEVFQRQLRGQKIWALEMLDANAKIPSGLMRGNTNQLGDFDLCTKISQKIKISETNSMKMKGKYCLANIDVVAAADLLKLPVHLILGRNFVRSTINDVSFVLNFLLLASSLTLQKKF